MRRSEMIKDKRRFNQVIKSGHYNKDKYFVVYSLPAQETGLPHFGIAIKKNIGHAVLRNRLKRQTRSLIDKNKKLFKNDRDYIIMIRDGCLFGSFDEMDRSIVDLLKGNK